MHQSHTSTKPSYHPILHFVAERADVFCLRFLWKSEVPLDRQSIRCQYPQGRGLIIPWPRMRRHALKLEYLHFFNGEQVWSPFVESALLQLVSLTKLQCCIRHRPIHSVWHLESLQALTAVGRSGNVASGSSTL